jgi:alpha-galactosidase
MRTRGLGGSDLVLVDTDREKLELMHRLADRMHEEWSADISVSSTADRATALRGATHVVLTVAKDRESTWRRDHEIAKAFGLTHYAENGGPGAFAHACRNFALILPMLRDIEQRCPSALLLIFTNPLARIATAVEMLTALRFVGVCHGVGIGYWLLANIFSRELGLTLDSDPRFLWRDDRIAVFEEFQRVARARYAITAAGLNHFTWMVRVHDRASGEDITAKLPDAMQNIHPRVEPLTQALFRVFGLLPVQGDTHVSEYVPFVARREQWRRYDIQLFDFRWAAKRRERHLEEVNILATGSGDITPLLHGESERAEFIIDAAVNDLGSREEAVNITNNGAIKNLPADAVVEVPATIHRAGIRGEAVGELPEAIVALMRTQVTINRLNVEAFLSGDRRLVEQLIAIDPMVTDVDRALALANAYIEEYKYEMSID